MDLEIFKPKHSGRVYLGNSCNYCFQINATNNLSRCSSCNAVSYCSKQHQKEDWRFHKPTCKALRVIKKQVEYPKNPNYETFTIYKDKLLEAMVKYRGLLGPEYLTEYERQICEFPLVCNFCYTPKTVYHCDDCEVALYCSQEHKRCDRRNHRDHCYYLKAFKLFSSLGYENGFKLEKYISLEYQPIRASIKEFPKETLILGKHIQNQIQNIVDEEEYVSLSLFLDPYIPAASIIQVMERIGSVKKRRLQRPQTIFRNKTDQSSNTLVIHLIMADDYELSFHWFKFANLFIDWIIDLKKVEIVLTGPKLEDCFIPSFEENEKYEIVVHTKSYHEVKNLSQPHIIVMFECVRIFHTKNNKFWSPAYQEFLFRYKDIPVVLFSGGHSTMMTVFEFLSGIRDIKCLKSFGENHLNESYICRAWNAKKHLSIYVKNVLFNVFTKC